MVVEGVASRPAIAAVHSDSKFCPGQRLMMYSLSGLQKGRRDATVSGSASFKETNAIVARVVVLQVPLHG